MSTPNPFSARYTAWLDGIKGRVSAFRETYPHLTRTSYADEIETVERMTAAVESIEAAARKLGATRPHSKIAEECRQVTGGMVEVLEQHISCLLALTEMRAEDEDDVTMIAHRNQQDEMRTA